MCVKLQRLTSDELTSSADNNDEHVAGVGDGATSQTLIVTDELTDAEITATTDAAAADGDHGDDDVVARNLQKRQSVFTRHNTDVYCYYYYYT